MAFTFAGRYAENLLSTTGAPLANTAVTVRLPGTTTAASLYTSRTKGTGAANPVSSDAYGNLAFYADPGYYDLLINGVTVAGILVPVDHELPAPNGTYARIIGVQGYAGVDPTGATDSSAGIRTAIAAAAATSRSGITFGGITSGVYLGTTVALDFGSGIYRCDTSLGDLSAYIHFIGDNAIIHSPTGVDILTNVGYQNWFRGITFMGGRHQITISTANTDTCVIAFDDCNFHSPSGSGIRTISPSNSTLLRIVGGKWYNSTYDCPALLLDTCDTAVMQDVWVTWGMGAAPVFDITTAILRLDGMFGIPASSSGVWIEFNGEGVATAKRCRFGGEAAGKSIIDIRATLDTSFPVTPSEVDIHDSVVYVPATGYVAKIFSPSNVLRLRGLTGNANGRGVTVDSAITAANKRLLQSQFFHLDVDSNMQTLNLTDQSADLTGMNAVSAASVRQAPTEYLVEADAVLNFASVSGGYGPSFTGATANPTNAWGRNMQRRLATANDDSLIIDHTTALAGLTTGVHTFVAWVETDHTCEVIVRAGGATRVVEIQKGKHIICLPFYWDSSITQSENLSVAVYRMRNGGTVDIGDKRLFKGNVLVTTPNTVIYGTAAPATGEWNKGDAVINQAPAAAGAPGWVCVAAGTPGTWKAMAVLAA